MPSSETTCWTVIRDAAAGARDARDLFARQYSPVVEAYLHARWHGATGRAQVPDALQEVFIECFREGGALQNVEKGRAGGFRAFLAAVTRNVARRLEASEKRGRGGASSTFAPDEIESDEESLSLVFDRAWAKQVVKEAARRHKQIATRKGEEALRRVELLGLRFHEGLPVRKIAERWEEPTEYVHRQYATARTEFMTALKEVLAFYNPAAPPEVERECERLLSLMEGN